MPKEYLTRKFLVGLRVSYLNFKNPRQINRDIFQCKVCCFLKSHSCLNSNITPAVSINPEVSTADDITIVVNGSRRFKPKIQPRGRLIVYDNVHSLTAIEKHGVGENI